MNGQTIFFVVVASLFGGVALCGLAVFLYVLLSAIRQMSSDASALTATLQPLLQGTDVKDSLAEIRKFGKLLGGLTETMRGHTTVMHEFNKLFLGTAYTKEVQDQYSKGTEEEISFFKAPTDEDMANEELKKQARDAGIEVDADRMEHPPDKSQMVGENA